MAPLGNAFHIGTMARRIEGNGKVVHSMVGYGMSLQHHLRIQPKFGGLLVLMRADFEACGPDTHGLAYMELGMECSLRHYHFFQYSLMSLV